MLSRLGRTTCSLTLRRRLPQAFSPVPRLTTHIARRCTSVPVVADLPPTSRAAQLHQAVLPVFRGISQVLFLENAATGCFILGVVTAVNPASGAALLAGAALSIFWAKLFNTNDFLYSSGIVAFNGILVAMALPVFIPHDIYLPIAIVAGTFLSTAFFDFGGRLLGPNLPLLSIPFCIVLWQILCVIQCTIPFTATPLPTGLHLEDPSKILETTLTTFPLSFSCLFFIENIYAGAALLGAAVATNWRTGVAGAAGAAIGIFTGLILGYDISSGLWGFNTALTAMALYPTFGAPFWLAMGSSAFAAALYPLAMNFFGGLGVPAVSATFCLATLVGLFVQKLLPKK